MGFIAAPGCGYRGAFWTPLSSLSYAGVVILDDFGSQSPRIRLDLGYPSSQAFSGSDPRGDERIIRALQAAGKLAPEKRQV